MRTAIVLPRQYEGQFVYEAKKSGLATKLHIDAPNTLSAEEAFEIDELMYARAWSTRQKIFQMVLLFDEIIIPGIDPINDYSGLEETGFFSFSSLDDYLNYASENELYDECIATSEYLKPVLIPVLYKRISCYYDNFVRGISKKKFVENIYHAFFEGMQTGKFAMTPKMQEAIELSEVKRVLKRAHNYMRDGTPKWIRDGLQRVSIYSELFSEVAYEYEYLNMLLDYANLRNANIVNCDFQLAKIGCGNADISNMLKNYTNIRIECKKAIGELPHITSLQDVITLKEKRGDDITRLRCVLGEFEETIRSAGKEQAIRKIQHDIQLATKDLNRNIPYLTKVGSWTTILSVPITVAEGLLHSLPVVGFPTSVIGAASLIGSKIMEKNSRWVQIVR